MASNDTSDTYRPDRSEEDYHIYIQLRYQISKLPFSSQCHTVIYDKKWSFLFVVIYTYTKNENVIKLKLCIIAVQAIEKIDYIGLIVMPSLDKHKCLRQHPNGECAKYRTLATDKGMIVITLEFGIWNLQFV